MQLFDLRTFLIVAVVFVPLERLFAFHKEQKVFRKEWKTDLLYIFVNGALIKIGVAVVIICVSAAARSFVPPSVQTAVRTQPLWLQFVEIVILADLGFYLAHRLFHSVPFLWEIHKVHHSIEQLDWLAAARVHPIDQILTKAASIFPLLVLGFSEGALGAFGLIYFWHSHLLHSNVNLRLGPLKWFIATPEYHRWHHADDQEAYDKNFAGQLSIIDKLFGTLYMPKTKRPEKYGMGERLPGNYLSHLIYPFRR